MITVLSYSSIDGKKYEDGYTSYLKNHFVDDDFLRRLDDEASMVLLSSCQLDLKQHLPAHFSNDRGGIITATDCGAFWYRENFFDSILSKNLLPMIGAGSYSSFPTAILSLYLQCRGHSVTLIEEKYYVIIALIEAVQTISNGESDFTVTCGYTSKSKTKVKDTNINSSLINGCFSALLGKTDNSLNEEGIIIEAMEYFDKKNFLDKLKKNIGNKEETVYEIGSPLNSFKNKLEELKKIFSGQFININKLFTSIEESCLFGIPYIFDKFTGRAHIICFMKNENVLFTIHKK